jgi:lipopolysaccharide biosynthesis regulator YciM
VLGNTESSYRYLKEMKRLGTIGERELSLFLCTVGENAVEQGDPKEAKKHLQKALKHQSDNAVALLALGNLEEKLGNENEALDRWKTAALISPELSADALKKIEHVMFHRGTFGEIERVYREVLEARPWDEYATLALASFYKKQGRGEDAIEFLEEFRSMHPGSIGTTVLLTSLYASHDDTGALDTFLEELETSATEAKVTFECGDCGFHAPGMRWHCPRCNSFNSFKKKHDD